MEEFWQLGGASIAAWLAGGKMFFEKNVEAVMCNTEAVMCKKVGSLFGTSYFSFRSDLL